MVNNKINRKAFRWRWFLPKRGSLPTFTWRDWERSWETSVRIADILIRIRTENLPNTSLEYYCYPRLLDPVCEHYIYVNQSLSYWVSTSAHLLLNSGGSYMFTCRLLKSQLAGHSFVTSAGSYPDILQETNILIRKALPSQVLLHFRYS
jgi:hypothetical protein